MRICNTYVLNLPNCITVLSCTGIICYIGYTCNYVAWGRLDVSFRRNLGVICIYSLDEDYSRACFRLH